MSITGGAIKLSMCVTTFNSIRKTKHQFSFLWDGSKSSFGVVCLILRFAMGEWYVTILDHMLH